MAKKIKKIKKKVRKTRREALKVKQEKTLADMKKRRQIDSDSLRTVIQQKLIWATNERQKGLNIIKETKHKITELEGIILFIKDLLEPEEK